MRHPLDPRHLPALRLPSELSLDQITRASSALLVVLPAHRVLEGQNGPTQLLSYERRTSERRPPPLWTELSLLSGASPGLRVLDAQRF